MWNLHQINNDTSAEGADETSPDEILFEAANKAHELGLLMEAYYNQKNEARIGTSLINAARKLMDELYSAHDWNYKCDEKWNIRALHEQLINLQKQDVELRLEAERIATEIAKLTWKINRNTRPGDEVRRELAGISKRIGELIGENGAPDEAKRNAI